MGHFAVLRGRLHALRAHGGIRKSIAFSVLLTLLVGVTGCGCDTDSKSSGEEDIDIVVGASDAGGGDLRALFDAEMPVELSPTASLGDLTLYGSTNPGFFAIAEDEPENGLFVLELGTTVGIEIVDIDAGAAVKFADTTLDAAGESYQLGTSPRIHFHPEWQLLLAEGDVAARTISFKLTTTSPVYSESAIYTVTLTIAP